jgi:hypothetical protein
MKSNIRSLKSTNTFGPKIISNLIPKCIEIREMTAGDRLTTRVVYLNMASRIDYDEMRWGKKAKTRHQEKEKMREEIGSLC